MEWNGLDYKSAQRESKKKKKKEGAASWNMVFLLLFKASCSWSRLKLCVHYKIDQLWSDHNSHVNYTASSPLCRNESVEPRGSSTIRVSTMARSLTLKQVVFDLYGHTTDLFLRKMAHPHSFDLHNQFGIFLTACNWQVLASFSISGLLWKTFFSVWRWLRFY